MSSGSPWSVKGIDPRARAVAKTAARREGVTLGEWLNKVILDDDEALAGDWTDQLEDYPGLDGRSRHGGDREALGAVVGRLGDRLEAAEQRSTLALTGVDQSLLALTRRLDALEDAGEHSSEDVEAALRAARAAQDEALDRIRRLERDAGANGDPAAVKALETTIGKLASRLFDTEQGVRGELDALGDRELRHARNTERALKTLDTRLQDAVNDERKERSALRDGVEDRHRRAAEAIAGLDRTTQTLRQRIETAEAGTHQALGALVTSQERLAERMRRAEALAGDRASAPAVEARFSAFADEIAGVIRDTRADFARQLSQAACTPQEIERALAATEARLQASEQRQSDALARIGTEIERLARTMDARLTEAERKAEARSQADETRRSRADLDSRIEAVREDNAQAIRRMGEQVARLGSSLADRVSQAEERSAAAVEAAGERVAGMLDRIENARAHGATEDELDTRIRASEERTAERIEAAMTRVSQTLQAAREQTEESLSPVQRAMTALAERLEAIEQRGAAPDRREMAQAPVFEDAFGAPVDLSEPLPLAPGLEDDAFGLDGDDVAAFEVSADPHDARADAPIGEPVGAPVDETRSADGFDAAQDDAFAAEPDLGAEPNWDDPAADAEPAAAAPPSRPRKPARKRAAPIGATADSAFIAAARASAQNRGPMPRGVRPRSQAAPAPRASRASSRLVLIAASVLGFLAIGAAAAVLIMDLRAGPPEAGTEPASLASLFADPQTPPAGGEALGAPDPVASTPEEALGETAAGAPDQSMADQSAMNQGGSAQDTPVADLAPQPARDEGEQTAARAEPQTLPAPPAAAPAQAPAPATPPRPVTLDAAAQAGDPIARYQLAVQREGAGYATGAAALMRRAAEQGVPDAQYRFAKMLERGEGVAQNPAAALQWTLTAARGGHARAMHNAGVMYATGLGTTENYEQAARWFEQAALHGVRDSQFNLALFFEQGLGVPQSLADAYAWFLIAGRAGDSAAAERAETMRRDVEPAARAQADRVADGFTARTLDPQVQGEYPPQPWRNGTDSDDVQRAQTLLAGLGYSTGAADGAWGPQTREAVSRYQADRNLPADGVVDAALIARLERDAAR